MLYCSPARNPSRGFRHLEQQVELGDAHLEAHRARFDGAEIDFAFRGVLEHEHDLENRGVAQRALWLQFLDELVERDFLVRIGIQGGALDLCHEIGKPRVIGRGPQAAPAYC